MEQGGRHRADEPAQVEISRDEDFRSVLYRQNVVADVERGFAVHHRADNAALKPGEQYFYRFYTCDENSPVGRFRTARPADSAEPVRIGFFSCQAFEAGFYTAHAGLAAEPDLDAVVCLGDYIYEKVFYNDPEARPDRTGRDKDGYVETLEEYRAKYALYHTDSRLLEVRRKFPLIAITDDHEVEDNYAGGTPGGEGREGGIPFAQRRNNGYRTFFEHMPRIRDPREADRTYGSIPLGRHAELMLLDTRQYRDDQPCGDQFFVPCTESEAPGRTLLGAAQKQWLKDRLAASPATWKVVANQVMIMSLDGPSRNEVNKDGWDGYAAERQELLEFLDQRKIQDVTFITGDIHTFLAGNVTATGRQGAADRPAAARDGVRRRRHHLARHPPQQHRRPGRAPPRAERRRQQPAHGLHELPREGLRGAGGDRGRAEGDVPRRPHRDGGPQRGLRPPALQGAARHRRGSARLSVAHEVDEQRRPPEAPGRQAAARVRLVVLAEAVAQRGTRERLDDVVGRVGVAELAHRRHEQPRGVDP